MDTATLTNILDEIKSIFSSLKKAYKNNQYKSEIKEIENEMAQDGFWNDIKNAEKKSRDLAHKKTILKNFDNLQSNVSEIKEFIELCLTDNSLQEQDKKDIFSNASKLLQDLKLFERKIFLNGEYDSGPCILSVYAGVGGTDAQDFAEMILRMYLRYCQKSNFKNKIINKIAGEQAGIKSASIEINGNFAYGFLKCENGTHRLVRLSPFNSKNLRQTSFAQVSVLPIIEENDKNIEIDPTDIRTDVFRSSGPGGQSVNTTDSAVRITYLPENIVVSCQNERSQIKNKEICMRILRGKIFEINEQKRQEKIAQQKGEKTKISWGNQIRNYILHPYKIVKDLRNGEETSNPESVFDGNIQNFINAELLRRAK